MTIRTLENLSDKLDSDLVWRKKELSDIKILIETRGFSHSKHNALLRSGITMLYAHWEGFVKTATSSYLEFVSMQQLSYRELKNSFVALAFKSKLNEISETNKATVFTEVTEFLFSGLDERSSLPYKDAIRTGANLSSVIFREILCVVSVDYSLFETKQKLLDEKLLARRNNIAHGEYLLLDRKDYLETHTQVIDMMELLRNQLDNCAAMKAYIRK